MEKLLNNLIYPLIVTFALIAIIVTLCTITLKNKSEKVKLIPIRIVFFLMIILEVIKIFALISRDGAYYANRLPIVFCSMVMYAYPLFCFKQNKFSDLAKGFSVILGFIAFILFASIQYNYNMSILQVHSYFFHGSMLGVSIYILTAKLYKFEFKKFYSLFLAFGGYIACAATLSLLIGGPISVFAPGDSYLGFLYNLSGFGVGICVMIIAVFVACFAIFGLIELCRRGRKKKGCALEEPSSEMGDKTEPVIVEKESAK